MTTRYDAEDLTLFDPIGNELSQPTTNEEDEDMGALKVGTLIEPPSLPGKWSVWSQSNESPGAYFVVPADDAARGLGVKYAVVRAKMPRAADRPVLTTLRTDPSVPLK